ncbi:LysR family transcriptional regulator [Hydrogenophaga sp.]|uniref:LysR family transcriptional regulator n=1 Tax=Hydrogenophaga sp. TaxID=1904254 RepID=UPI0025C1FEEB|nr:LysR family transcriptional regulator [Hydrogenophaga sp.]MBT9464096.1 LysR family transcriptional regulator [Hydrogenophaga sp.]
MTLVQLRHFVVLADVGSFVQASAVLFLTQPALTRSIHALEEELGGALFDRLGRRISLTPFGDEVLARARRLVSDAEALKQAGQGLHAGLIGQLRVGLSSAPGALLSTPLMLHMAEHHPRLQVHISRGRTAVLLNALREQHLDAAIVDIRDMRPSAELKVSLAFELTAGFLVRPDHPMALRSGPVSIEDVMAYPVASTPLSDEVARILIARYGPQANPDDMVTLRCDETMSIVEVARRSNAVLLTVHAVAADLVRLDVSPGLDATARFGLVTLAKRQEAPAIRILREHLPNWTDALTFTP